ncbi:MAG TPA: tRNA pseudouridine(38-40) synthase TruA [Perlabentimonas sp.]|nr:tRNA pseudouridine(38-40) synthase TruA [Bacteroidales bacterium]MDD4672159.1 tRNA pseudouridine(38-40) synthase TruA [Bacteroidales bacterium]MDY0348002.1 tRNA pseudouridine(38-40) synthase TruA [Tenuifilaceae bacterium]HZJ73689.1 tRNA pseudouridine(38-40) synthase TruA [Perlabentimonas sp.]
MQRYFIELAYLGTNYCGWQIQPNANTIQAEIEKALSTILREDISVVGAGRTDAGVHASFFVAHFDSPQEKLNKDLKLLASLNSILPKDIAVKEIVAVIPDAHARFTALSRTYEYKISRHKDPFNIDTSWLYKTKLDVDKMKRASSKLLFYRDYTSFSKLGSDVKTYNCKIFFALWEQKESELVFTIRADRFLRNMVRAIVGTLIDVGRGKISEDEFVQIIEAKNRSLAGTSAPAEGLFLTNVEYPVNIFVG